MPTTKCANSYPQSDASVSRVSNCGKWRHSQFTHPPSTLRHMAFQFPYVLLENPKPCICALIKSSSFPALQCLPFSSHCFSLSYPHVFGFFIIHWVLFLLVSAYMIIYLLEQGWSLRGCIPNGNRLSPVHQSSLASQLEVGHHEPFSPSHAGSLSGLILCRACAGSSRCCELIYSLPCSVLMKLFGCSYLPPLDFTFVCFIFAFSRSPLNLGRMWGVIWEVMWYSKHLSHLLYS